MKNKSQFRKVQLSIKATPGVEIFLIDGTMRRVGSSVGSMECEVAPGVYRLRVRASASQEDEFIVVTGEQEYMEIEAPRIEYRTAIPLLASISDSLNIANEAAASSRQVTKTLDSGESQLFLFLHGRQFHERTSNQTKIAVHSLPGELVYELRNPSQTDKLGYSFENAALDEGTYRLSVNDTHVGNFEIFVTLVAGWQTQIFMNYARFDTDRGIVACPSINQAGMLMTRVGRGFLPDSPVAQLTDLAQHALVQNRSSLAKSALRDVLYSKYEDPLLGILGAHLLLMETRPDRQLLKKVCQNLFQLMPDHPDVKILSLSVEGPKMERVHAVNRPPMLRASWELLVSASRRRASLVPANSLAAKIARNSVVGHPWLIHEVREGIEPWQPTGISLAEAERITESLLELNGPELARLVSEARDEGEKFSGIEETLIQSLLYRTSSLTIDQHPEESESFEFLFTPEKPSAQQVMSSLDAPSYAVAESVQSVANKLQVTKWEQYS